MNAQGLHGAKPTETPVYWARSLRFGAQMGKIAPFSGVALRGAGAGQGQRAGRANPAIGGIFRPEPMRPGPQTRRAETCREGTGSERPARLLGPHASTQNRKIGWGGRIRTYGTRYQKPTPYHLATPQLAAVFSQAGGWLQEEKVTNLFAACHAMRLSPEPWKRPM